MPQIEELREHLKKDKRIYEVSGLIDSLKPHLIYGIGYDVPIKLIVTFDEMRAKQIYEGYQFFDENTLYYPARDLLFYQSDIHSNALTRERLSVVQALIEHRPVTVVTTMDALMNRVPPLSSYERGIFTIDLEETVDLDEMRKKLVMLGYENVTQVEHPGEFAVRGGIVDIFPLTEEHPIRMELWGDEIDSLRYFDVATQKSIDSVEHVTVYPAMELVLTQEEIETGLKRMEADAEELYQKYRSLMRTEEAHRIKTGVEQLATETREWGLGLGLETHLNYFVSQTESLLSYFPPETLVFLDELVHLDEKGKVIEQEFSDSMTSRLEKGYCLPGQLEMLLTTKSVFAMLQKHPGVVLSTLDSREGLLSIAGIFGILMAGPRLANIVPPLAAFAVNAVCILLLMILGCHNVIMYNHSTFVLGYLLLLGYDVTGKEYTFRVIGLLVGMVICMIVFYKNQRNRAYRRTFLDLFREFDLKSARSRWYVKLTLIVSSAMLFMNLLGLPRAMWAGIACMSVCLPFTEDCIPRSVSRGMFNVVGCLLFIVLYLVLPKSMYPYIGMIGGIGVGYSAGYPWQTAFNTFGALSIAAGIFGMPAAIALRIGANVLGAAYTVICNKVTDKVAEYIGTNKCAENLS